MNAERFLPWNLSNPAFIPDMADRSVDLLIYPENGGRRYTMCIESMDCDAAKTAHDAGPDDA